MPHQPGHARDVDDRAAVDAAHQPERLARAVEGAVEVHRQHPAPRLVGQRLGDVPVRLRPCRPSSSRRSAPRPWRAKASRPDGVHLADAGVVDQHVEPAERPLDLLEHRAHLAALSATSATIARARPAPISAAARSALSLWMSLTTTRAPSSAKRCAMARPMPEPPPVTSATFPSSRMTTSRLRPSRPRAASSRKCGMTSSAKSCIISSVFSWRAAVHARAHDAGLQLVGEHAQLVAHGGRAAADDVAALLQVLVRQLGGHLAARARAGGAATTRVV